MQTEFIVLSKIISKENVPVCGYLVIYLCATLAKLESSNGLFKTCIVFSHLHVRLILNAIRTHHCRTSEPSFEFLVGVCINN